MQGPIHRFPVPTPLPVGDVNAYYLPGRHPALIDAGPRTPAADASLRAALGDRPVEVLVVTHQHADHAGLAATLKRERGVRLLLHAGDAAALEHWSAHARAREADYAEGLLRAGVPPDERERLRYGGRKYDDWSEPVRVDATFHEGDRLDLGDHAWQVVDAPGHTPGSHLLHCADVGATFSGDTLLEHITPNAVSVRASERGALETYLASLRRLEPTEWGLVHPGHGKPFSGAGGVIRRALEHAERRQARILASLGAEGRSAWDLVHRLFPRLPGDQVFLAVSEVLGHLEILRRRGSVRVDASDGIDHYRVKATP